MSADENETVQRTGAASESTAAAAGAAPAGSAASAEEAGPAADSLRTGNAGDSDQAFSAKRQTEVKRDNFGYVVGGDFTEGDRHTETHNHTHNHTHNYYTAAEYPAPPSKAKKDESDDRRRQARESAAGMEVQAGLAFIASRSADLGVVEFCRIADALLEAKNALTAGDDADKGASGEARKPLSPLNLWRSDQAGFLEAAGIAPASAPDGRTIVLPAKKKISAALAKRLGPRVALAEARAFWRVLESRLLFDPAERVRHFSRDIVIEAVAADPTSAGLYLLRVLENALFGTDNREVYSCAALLDGLWARGFARERLEAMCHRIAQKPAGIAVVAIASAATQIPLSVRSAVVFDALDALDQARSGFPDDTTALERIFAFLYTRNWQLHEHESEGWRKATLERIAQDHAGTSVHAAFSAAAAARLFDPARACHSFVATLRTLVDPETCAWILRRLYIPELREALRQAVEFLNHGSMSNWVLAFSADAFLDTECGPGCDAWQRWSKSVLADHPWLTRGFRSVDAGVMVLAEWHFRNERKTHDVVATFAQKLDRASVLKSVKNLFDENQRLILALQGDNVVTFLKGSKIPMRGMSAPERRRLIAPLVARRPALQRLAALLRSAPRPTSVPAASSQL